MELFSRVMREWFTGPGSREFELARLLFAIVVVAGVVMQGIALAKGQSFSMLDFGTGMGGLLTLGGLGTKLKDEGAAKAAATEA